MNSMDRRFGEQQTKTGARLRLEKSPPVCDKHNVPMLCRSTRATVRYFYCPIKDCKCSASQSRIA